MSKIIELKGSVLSLSVLKVYSDEIKQVKKHLEQKIVQAPEFFIGLAVVIEPEVDALDATFLALLVEFLHQKQMMLIGLRTANPMMREQASYAGLAVFDPVKKSENRVEKTIEPASQGAMFIEGAVRSGQQVYAQGRDLVIKGSINPGAEVVADGHVHVYGNVKGKVFAGSAGNTDARIYAQKLDAELVCIAGFYQMAEDIKPEFKQGLVEVHLDNDRLVFHKLV